MSEQSYKKKTPLPSASAAGRTPEASSALPDSVMESIARGTMAPTASMLGRRETLAPSLQAKMQGAFGADFGNLEVYRSETARSVGMLGVASGNKVALSPDVDLNSHAGQSVLGHELSHVVAQARGVGSGRGFLGNSSLERQADVEGELAASGMRAFAGGGLETGVSLDLSAPTMTMGGSEAAGLTPISATTGAFGMGAPMQGKKCMETEEPDRDDPIGDFQLQDEFVNGLTNIPQTAPDNLGLSPENQNLHDKNVQQVRDFMSQARGYATNPDINPEKRDTLSHQFMHGYNTGNLVTTMDSINTPSARRTAAVSDYRERNNIAEYNNVKPLEVLAASRDYENAGGFTDEEGGDFINHVFSVWRGNHAVDPANISSEEKQQHIAAYIGDLLQAGNNMRTHALQPTRDETDAPMFSQGDLAAQMIRSYSNFGTMQHISDIGKETMRLSTGNTLSDEQKKQLVRNHLLISMHTVAMGGIFKSKLNQMENSQDTHNGSEANLHRPLEGGTLDSKAERIKVMEMMKRLLPGEYAELGKDITYDELWD